MRSQWLAVAAIVATGVTSAAAQDTAEVRSHFQAGRHQEVVASAGPEAAPDVIFMAAQSQQKLGAVEPARELYTRLVARPDADPWHFVGQSAAELLADNTDAALASADRAVAINADLPEAHYQRGLVLARRQDWRVAAEAFDRTAQLDPANAYAAYYAGLMHYRAKRPDLMASRFERFLKLAPDAPERPEVLQIMRTVRGR
jgi:tetratricopeptide (TPR) repeat protein